MKISEIVEARRNPEQNKKLDFEKHLHDFYNNLPKDQKNSWFVHFTATPRFGIKITQPTLEASNLGPLGIYSYPLRVPYSDDYFEFMPFAYLFRVDSKYILNSKKTSPISAKTITTQILKYVKEKYFDRYDNVKNELKNLSSKGLDVYNTIKKVVDYLADDVGDAEDNPEYKNLTNKAKLLNILLRKIGFQLIVNFGGIIPYEAVLLNPSFAIEKQFFRIGQEYKQHPDEFDDYTTSNFKDVQKIYKNYDKIDPSTGSKTSRYPNIFAGSNMDMPYGRDRHSSLTRYIKNAIQHVRAGKQPPARKQAEDMISAYIRPNSPKPYNFDIPEMLMIYKALVLDPLNLQPLNDDLKKYLNKILSNYGPITQDTIDGFDHTLQFQLGINN